MAITMSMGDGPGKQKKKARKFNAAQGKAIAEQKAKRVAAYNADPRARKGGAFTEKMARFNPNLELTEEGYYKGVNKPGGKARRNVKLRPKFGWENGKN